MFRLMITNMHSGKHCSLWRLIHYKKSQQVVEYSTNTNNLFMYLFFANINPCTLCLFLVDYSFDETCTNPTVHKKVIRSIRFFFWKSPFITLYETRTDFTYCFNRKRSYNSRLDNTKLAFYSVQFLVKHGVTRRKS